MSGEEGRGRGGEGGAEWWSCPPCTFPIALREQIAEGQRGQNGLCNCKLVRKFKISPPSTPDTVRSPGPSCAAPRRLPGLGKGRGGRCHVRRPPGLGAGSAARPWHQSLRPIPEPRPPPPYSKRSPSFAGSESRLHFSPSHVPPREGTSREHHAFRLDRALSGTAAVLSPSPLRSAGPARASRRPRCLAPDNPMGEQRAGVQSVEPRGAVPASATPRLQRHCPESRRQRCGTATHAHSAAA